ncbi:ribokinase [Desulfotomaculum nigrificans CO-1-SRB]|uniref:Ribokinase n=1 Tax=Desulfotomaculum nigrificans (strain DSM 14880 / VKM B-2319 / CO-1-SRB) TaxID=868595 RepID=F6B8R1_DESCC|nr:ribokinase [Desulfotomaculum nigrificans]AEF94754.1 ribokinase [Desulfotomaculum nigrificans CO-1-SRB]
MPKPHVLVIGSLNMDLVSYSDRIPHVGETVLGQRFATVPGGKGANQAMAAVKLGAKVTMLGAVGNDSYGDQLLSHLKQHGVDTTRVLRTGSTTGVALINVDANGNNQIVVVPGANYDLGPAELVRRQQVFADADVVVLQLEIPLPTVGQAIELAHKYHKPVILNPAPAQPLPDDWLNQVDYLIPNEHEALLLAGSEENFYVALRQKMKHTLIVTRGEKGVTFMHQNQLVSVPAFMVQAVDTTAAGDAFIGGFSVALAEGLGLPEAIRFGCAVAALSVTKEGAQTSLPLRQEVEHFMGGLKQ